MPHGLIVTSWPLALGAGSGTALFIQSLRRAVEAAGQSVELINPPLDASDYARFTFERLWFNTQLPRDPRPANADWILGIDYDGFALPRRPAQRFVASARAVFAEIVPTEPEPFRTLLTAQAYFEGHNLRAADWVVTPSQYAREAVARHYHVPPDKIKVIPNGVDLAEWDAHWRALPEPEPERRPTVLAVSKLYPRKRIDILIRAAPFLRERYRDVDVRIVGGGFEWEAWRRLSEEIGAAPNVTWLGDVDDRRAVVNEFKRCHVFTHTSIQEAFGNVLMEAMASSKPIVAAEAACLPEMIRASGGGQLVPPNDPEALAAALSDLLDDEARRAELGRRGRAYAEAMTWKRCAARYLELLQ
jgi:glycosyltransferase involved in cell wall biosynthesis